MKYDIIKSVNYLARDSSGALYGYKEMPRLLEYPNGEFSWSEKVGTFVIFIRERDNALSFIEAREKQYWTVNVVEDLPQYNVLHLTNKSRSIAISRFGNQIEVVEGEKVDSVIIENTTLEKEVSEQRWKAINFVKKILGDFLVLPRKMFKIKKREK